MLKNFLKSLFENIYTPEIDPLEYIQKFVSPSYKQIVDGHDIDYVEFIEHINKQREVVRDVKFKFIFLVEEGDTVASIHRIKAQIKPNNCEIIAEVHAFFEFKDRMLVSCD